MMQYPGRRLEKRAPSRTSEAKRKIDVFEVTSKVFRKIPNLFQCGSAKKASRPVGTKYVSHVRSRGINSLAMLKLSSDASQAVTVSGTINARSVRPTQHQGSYRTHAWIRETGERFVGPSGLNFGVVVEKFNDLPLRDRQPGVHGGAKTLSAISAKHADFRKGRRRSRNEVILRCVVHDQDFRTFRSMRMHALQADAKQIGP